MIRLRITLGAMAVASAALALANAREGAPGTPLVNGARDSQPVAHAAPTPGRLRDARLDEVVFRGRAALRLTETASARGEALALLETPPFFVGTIEASVAGLVAPGAPDDARGFIGVAFRVQGDLGHFDCVYVRPANARSTDQVRRNHSTQYVAHPEWPWHRLRREFPGRYESYADLEPGGWNRLRVEVARDHARLFLNGADQPALIVDDLRGPTDAGGVALWIGEGTEGYFSDLVVSPRP